MIRSLVDNTIATFAPQWAMRRLYARATMQQIENLVGTKAGYKAGIPSRTNPYVMGEGLNENAIPREQVDRLRQQSWKLYRDNPGAKKIVRTLEAKVIGRFPKPQSQATHADGEPFLEFRRRASELWKAVYKQLDYRGEPGRGGQHLVDLHKTALRGTVLGGEVLPRFKYLTMSEMRRKGLIVPLKLQLIHADRLDETLIDDNIFYGIEFDGDEQRVAYHILDAHPADPRYAARIGATKRVDAKYMTHLYVSDDIDQIRGVPWFSAVLLKATRTEDIESHELVAAAQAACVVLGYRRSQGQTGFGLQEQGSPLTDMHGNAVTHLQPGMLVDLGQSGDLVPFNPQRPNASLPEFIQHMLRSQAAGVPGVKSSTLIGDYRGSSFSSERAADNDVWPEIESVQDWFFHTFSQPLFEEIITAGVLVGYFDQVKGFSRRDFEQRQGEFLNANWQGPVAKSIKPSEDEEASKRRKGNGRSTVQREAAIAGADIDEIMAENSEFIKSAREWGMPEEWIMSALGIEKAAPVSVPSEDAKTDEEPEDDDDSQETEDEADETLESAEV